MGGSKKREKTTEKLYSPKKYIFHLDQFEMGYLSTYKGDKTDVWSVLFYHLFDFNVEEGKFLNWEEELRKYSNLGFIYALLQNYDFRKVYKRTKGKLILIQSLWEKTHDVYKSMRLTKGMRFASKELVREYVLTHKSVRILAKNGKRRNSNKSQYLAIRRSLLGLERVKISEREAERIFRAHERGIIATGDSHIYLYADIHYALSQTFFHEGVQEEVEVEIRDQEFGSYHLDIYSLFTNPSKWYLSVDEFIKRLKDFMQHESVRIISGVFNLVVRTFKDEVYWQKFSKAGKRAG